MTVLLDTHAWIWLASDPDRLGPSTRELLEDPLRRVLLSAASSWEIAIKFALGRLGLPDHPERFVPAQLRAQGIEPIAVEHAHVLRVASLPWHHGDPFDRLLIAQAQELGIPLVTVDTQLSVYDAKLIDART